MSDDVIAGLFRGLTFPFLDRIRCPVILNAPFLAITCTASHGAQTKK